MIASTAPTTSSPSPIRPSIARRTKAATWFGNERETLPEVRVRLHRYRRALLSEGRKHAGRDPSKDAGGGGGGGVERAVVMDFGLAKERRADPAIAKLTATGIILGTPEFMSPEQIRGKQLDARSDIYALGIVAFEMFTGKLPFHGRNAQEMMIARLRGHPLKLRQLRPDLPEGLERTLGRALESNPDARYATALEFADALSHFQEGGLLSKIKEKLK